MEVQTAALEVVEVLGTAEVEAEGLVVGKDPVKTIGTEVAEVAHTTSTVPAILRRSILLGTQMYLGLPPVRSAAGRIVGMGFSW